MSLKSGITSFKYDLIQDQVIQLKTIKKNCVSAFSHIVLSSA